MADRDGEEVVLTSFGKRTGVTDSRHGQHVFTLGEYVLPDSPHGQVALTIDVDSAGRLLCTGFRLSATEQHPEIVAKDLRDVGFSAYLDQVFIAAGWRPQVEALGAGVYRLTSGESGPSRGDKVANNRRRRVNQENLQRVASIVKAAPKAPHERADALASREAYQRISAEFDLEHRTAQLWVQRARKEGLL